VQVIELKDDWIVLSAIDARVIAEVGEHLCVERVSYPLCVGQHVGHVTFPVAQVPSLLVAAFARATPCLEELLGAVLEAKLS
jgi:hypothetical protein